MEKRFVVLIVLFLGALGMFLVKQADPPHASEAPLSIPVTADSPRVEPVLTVPSQTVAISAATSPEKILFTDIQGLRFPDSKHVRKQIGRDVHVTPDAFRSLAMEIAPLMEGVMAEIAQSPRRATMPVNAFAQKLMSCASGADAGPHPVRALCWYNLKRIAHASRDSSLRAQVQRFGGSLPPRILKMATSIGS